MRRGLHALAQAPGNGAAHSRKWYFDDFAAINECRRRFNHWNECRRRRGCCMRQRGLNIHLDDAPIWAGATNLLVIDALLFGKTTGERRDENTPLRIV